MSFSKSFRAKSFRAFTATLLLSVAVFGSASTADAKARVEVAFVLDTTGSMSGLIEGAKRKIWSIASTIADANPDADVYMGLVAYRDIGDEYVTRVFPLTSDIQGLYGNLLQQRAAGGGDWPESVNEALDKAVTGLQWTQGPDVNRIVFLVGDAPPHMDYPQDRKYPEVLRDARTRGIVVNAVQAGNAADTARVWRSIAQLGGGQYIPIPQDGGRVVVIDTPYDEEIIILQRRINETILPYGSPSQRAAVARKQEQVASAPRSSASDMAGYVNKTGKGRDAVTGEGDLVGDVKQGRKRLEAVPDAELPDALRGLSQGERAKKIETLNAAREELSRTMTDLVGKREAFQREKRVAATNSGAPKGDSFDVKVEETLRAQIKR